MLENIVWGEERERKIYLVTDYKGFWILSQEQ